MMRRSLLLATAALTLAACGSQPRRSGDRVLDRDAALAQKHIRAGIEAYGEGDLTRAIAAFEAAVEADAFSGAAHNNLGKVYFHQNKLYLAAKEFGYAAKLLPDRPEPRNNLGMVFESAGQLDEAVAEYELALEVGPDSPMLLGNLARARVRRGDGGDEMRDLLSDLVMRESRPEWLTWARAELSRRGDSPLPANLTIERPTR